MPGTTGQAGAPGYLPGRLRHTPLLFLLIQLLLLNFLTEPSAGRTLWRLPTTLSLPGGASQGALGRKLREALHVNKYAIHAYTHGPVTGRHPEVHSALQRR